MLHDKVFGVGFMAAAASMFGYSYMQKEKAFEELNQTFFRMKNEWEESKEKLIDSLFSQEVKIKDMEEERKTRDLKILKTEEKIKEMEQEREQERKEWEDHRLQLIREKEELSQRFLYADNDDDVNQTPMKKNERDEDTLQLIRDEDAPSQKCLPAEKDEGVNRQTLIEENEREDNTLQLTRETDAPSQKILSAEEDEHVNQTPIKNNEREDDGLQLIVEMDELSQTFLSAEKDEDEMKTTEKLIQIMEEMEDIQENKTAIEKNEWEEEAKDKLLENVLLPGEKNEGVEVDMKTRELLNMEEKIKHMAAQLREENKREEILLEVLIGERESLSLSFLSAEQESEDMTNKMKTTEEEEVDEMEEMEVDEMEEMEVDEMEELEVDEMEEMEDVQKWTNQFSHVCELTMDVQTANRYLSLSENNRKVTRKVTKVTPVREIKVYRSDSSDRFYYWQQVMCREGLTERCYCVVEWGGKVSIAVTYKGIKRTGWHDDGLFGNNDKSWSLECTLGRYTVCHNKKKTVLAVRPSGSNRVGMYLDYHSGILSFYRVSDTRTQLHTFLYTFTEPLYPGFWLGNDSYVSLLDKENDLQTSQALVVKSAAESLDIEVGHNIPYTL